jgi:hypothetical protein
MPAMSRRRVFSGPVAVLAGILVSLCVFGAPADAAASSHPTALRKFSFASRNSLKSSSLDPLVPLRGGADAMKVHARARLDDVALRESLCPSAAETVTCRMIRCGLSGDVCCPA